MQGYRTIHEKRAVAYDRLPERARDEFRRKVRTLAGNFQLAARLPHSLLPWRNPVWLQFVSHKLLRLAVPWALLALLALSAILPGEGYRALWWAQIGFYLVALLGNVQAVGSRFRPAGAAASLVVLNAAAWLAFWVWVTGRAARSWGKVYYKPLASQPLQAGAIARISG
jgi:biofilm PGA synthesis N-glycosyltransferase PgaC